MVGLLTSISLCTLTGCLGDEEMNDERSVTAVVTLFEEQDGGCYCAVDGGGVLRITASSIQKTLSENGISGIKRAVVGCTFSDKNRSKNPTTDEIVISNANLFAFLAIPIFPVYVSNSSEEADSVIAVVSQPDSIDAIDQINELYVYNGYLTIDFRAPCHYKVMPALTIVCDSLKGKDVYFRMLYNDHHVSDLSTIDGYTTLNKYLYSYNLANSGIELPQDSVMLHFTTQCRSNLDYKVDLKVAPERFRPYFRYGYTVKI